MSQTETSKNEIARFDNAETAMQSKVFLRPDGFSVVLIDLDSGMVAPAITIFPHSMIGAERLAIEKAQRMVC